jgi:alkylation response protein AidB-like acyl-CoA dehydrogenase
VGRLNEGWSIAKRLLQHERTMISSFGLSSGQSDRGGTTTSNLASVEAAAMHYRGDSDRLSDAVLRDRIAQFKIDSAAFAYTSQRSIEESKQGQGPNATSSMLKNYGCELNKRRYELLMQALGSQGLGWEGDGFNSDELQVTREWLRSKANSIEGGTSEIQLNVIAKRVLGLPDIMSMSKQQGSK